MFTNNVIKIKKIIYWIISIIAIGTVLFCVLFTIISAAIYFPTIIPSFMFTPDKAKKQLQKIDNIEIVKFFNSGSPGDYFIHAIIKIRNTDNKIELIGIENNYLTKTKRLMIGKFGKIEFSGIKYSLNTNKELERFYAINFASDEGFNLIGVKIQNIKDIINNYDKINLELLKQYDLKIKNQDTYIGPLEYYDKKGNKTVITLLNVD